MRRSQNPGLTSVNVTSEESPTLVTAGKTTAFGTPPFGLSERIAPFARANRSKLNMPDVRVPEGLTPLKFTPLVEMKARAKRFPGYCPTYVRYRVIDWP